MNPKPIHKAAFETRPVMIFALYDQRTHIGLPGKLAPDHPRVASIFNSSMASGFVYMHLVATSLLD